MKRRIFNIAKVISLILLLLTAALWISSQFHPVCRGKLLWTEDGDQIKYQLTAWGWDDYGLYSRHAKCESQYNASGLGSGAADQAYMHGKLLEVCPANTATGFWAEAVPAFTQFVVGRTVFSGSGQSYLCSFESLAIWLAVLPAIWLAIAIYHWIDRYHVGRIGLCARCGYDLRATPGRCPECGLIPSRV